VSSFGESRLRIQGQARKQHAPHLSLSIKSDTKTIQEKQIGNVRRNLKSRGKKAIQAAHSLRVLKDCELVVLETKTIQPSRFGPGKSSPMTISI
jgi:hypothetical protein